MKMRLRLVLLVAISQLGCQAIAYGTASDFNGMRLGMSHAEVINQLGPPLSTEADADRSEQRLV